MNMKGVDNLIQKQMGKKVLIIFILLIIFSWKSLDYYNSVYIIKKNQKNMKNIVLK